jgi:asparagine synthase (glutamine-hydrolysing)
MCGITFLYDRINPTLAKGKDSNQEPLSKDSVDSISKLLHHRGPDARLSHEYKQDRVVLAHERLSIIDVATGQQPLFNEDRTVAVIENGENYNYLQLTEQLIKKGHRFKSSSDAEIIVHMYEQFGEIETAKRIDGDFAFVVYDSTRKRVFAARDPIGIKPLYIGTKENSTLVYLASEMKVLLAAECDSIQVFPPGHVYIDQQKGSVEELTSTMGSLTRYYKPDWFDPTVFHKEDVDLEKIRETFEAAVKKRMMSEVPLGVFLSGGLDSSLVAALVRKNIPKDQELHSFAIGIGASSSSDCVAARQVAKHIGTNHHERIFTIDEGIEAVKKVIYHLESYDVTTVRATTPMFLLSEYAKKYITVCLSGEGSDEMFAGYVYFQDAKSPEELQCELVEKIKNLHLADVQRCDRASSGNGVEARVPFLDHTFLDLVMRINPAQKMFGYDGDSTYAKDGDKKRSMEKYILRKAFDGIDLLPDEVLWRTKVQFGDGVGFSWIDSLKEYAENNVSDEDFANASKIYPHNTPISKEAFLYRRIFHEHFPQEIAAKTVGKWLPWSKFETDPSGRFQRSYNEEKDEKKVNKEIESPRGAKKRAQGAVANSRSFIDANKGKIRAEYIWIGGIEPEGDIRCKTRTLDGPITSIDQLPDWNYDGSSTNQADGNDSDVIIKPRALFRDPFRGENDVLVMCDAYFGNGKPIPSNTRAAAQEIFDKVQDQKTLYGIEQEYIMYTLAKAPLGFPNTGFPEPQGPYYCGVGAGKAFGRNLVEEHYELCLKAGVMIGGSNAEVCCGQWEFQVGPCEGIDVGDHLWVARYILSRLGENYGISICLDPKPISGEWNGSGAHTNFSTEKMRQKGGIDHIMAAIEKLSMRHDEHIKAYGHGNEKRLTGKHETQSIEKFSFGIADRGSSIRIPRQVGIDKKGYLEDRRPAANVDPYVVSSMIAETTLLM